VEKPGVPGSAIESVATTAGGAEIGLVKWFGADIIPVASRAHADEYPTLVTRSVPA
jgi:hypothetical protein